ncbi:MAG: hypothetical protein AAB874_00365, partial [Patescibacteria group bacterium]
MLRIVKKNLTLIIVSLLIWYAVLVILFDLGGIHKVRETLSRVPVIRRLDPVFGNAMASVFHQNYRFSRIFDLFFAGAYLTPETLPRYQLTVPLNNLQQLDGAAQKSLQTPDGFLVDANNIEVSAVFNFKNKNYQVKIKYRGDNQTHWSTHHKSWKIIF